MLESLILRRFTYIVRIFEKVIMKYKPSLNDFTYYLVYLEYAHIGNYSHMEGFEHLSNAFLDLALEIYSQLSHL